MVPENTKMNNHDRSCYECNDYYGSNCAALTGTVYLIDINPC